VKYLTSLLLLLSVTSHAFTNEDLVHLTAHTGASYMLQTTFYGLNSKVLKQNFWTSEGLAMAETLAVGLLYKAVENTPTNQLGLPIAEDLFGASLAIGTHVSFHF
jgi:hypothetical protein